MLTAHWHDTIVELRSGRDHELDASRWSAVLAAYFDAEHACVFRRLLWQRLGIIVGIAVALEGGTRLVSVGAFAIVLAILCGTALVGLVVERRAERKFLRLIEHVFERYPRPQGMTDSRPR